ncbi:MAG: carboxypeptidase regulatory-like domain-containing protein [Terracidiphilus sp.]
MQFTLVAILTILFLLSPKSAQAQNAQGTIVGHIVDPSGAAVVGAKVTIKEASTGVVHSSVTSSSGDYSVPDLNPGHYSVTVEAPGFSKEVSPDLTLEIEQTLRQSFSLQVGNVSSTVEVSAETQMLHTDDTTVGQVIQGDLIESLPINGRDFTNLMLTNAGTNITPGGSGGDWGYHGLNTAYTEVSADGGQAQSASYNVDGIYDADFFFSVPINIPNELAVQEFKMLNGMYGAQYGQGGAQVNVAIKSGTNRVHGAAYETLQNAFLQPANAITAEQNRLDGGNASTRPPYHQDEFGGVLGGPLTIPHVYSGRDKTFWLVSYDEGLKGQHNNPQSAFVPTAAEVSGDFSAWPYPIYDPLTTVVNPSYNPNAPLSPTNLPVIRTQFDGNKIPTGRLDPVAQKLALYYAQPNNTSCDDTTHILTKCGNWLGSTTQSKNQGVGTGRIDEYLTANDHMFFTANVGNLYQTQGSIAFGQGGSVYARPKLFGGTWTHTFGPKLLNQATLGYIRDHYLNGTTTAYGPNLSEEVGLANTAPNPVTFDLPQITMYNYQSIGGGEPTTYADNIYQGVDTVTLARGRHTLNFGIDFRRLNLFELDNYDGTGTLGFNGQYTSVAPAAAGGLTNNGALSPNAPYEGNALADFMLGNTQSASGPPPLATDDYVLWGNNWNLFVQDDIKASDRLTLNLGLRWERPANLHDTQNSGFAFNPANGGQFVWANCAFTKPILAAGGNPSYLGCGAANTLVPIDKKDFAPRLGFSYRPPFSEKFLVRGGFGIFFGTYNRYYDGSQFDKDLLYNETAAPYISTTGLETQSTAVLKNLWSAPINADQTFTAPRYEFGFNQVNWPTNHNPYDEQWSFDTQYSLTKTLLLDIGYVGAHGLHQPSQDFLGAGTEPTVANDSCNALADVALATGDNAYCLTDPNFQSIDSRAPYANMPAYLYGNYNGFQSTYEALQAQLIERSTHGLSYHLNYTYSKTMDLTSGINLINGEQSIIEDPHHPYLEYGLSASDQTHRLVATYAYEVPRDMFHFVGSKWLMAGWTTSGVYQLASGFPFSISGGVSQEQMIGLPYWTGRILADSTYHNSAGFKPSLGEWFDTSKYSTPLPGRYGNTNKSPERTPYFTNFDFSLGKTTHVTEGQSLLLRVEVFNAFSTWRASTSLDFPDSTVTDGNFGSLIDKTYPGNVSLFNPRVVQLTAQYSF